MAKPIGITLGIVGAKAPLPPEAVLAHAKPLQVEITELPAEPAKPKRSRKVQLPEPIAAVEPTGGHVIDLALPAEPSSDVP